jgi:hypothetical protein
LLLEERDRDELLEEGFAIRSARLAFAVAFFLGAFRRAARAFEVFLRAFFGDLARFFFFISPPSARSGPIMSCPSRRARELGKTILNCIHVGMPALPLAPAAPAAIMPA